MITLAQTMFNPHTDYIELNQNGEVIGMWADYYSTEIKPEDYQEKEQTPSIISKISFSGTQKKEIKIGGNYKKFTVKFYQNNDEIKYINGIWSCSIDGKDCSSLVSILDNSSSTDVDIDQIKLKFNLGQKDNNGKYPGNSHIGEIIRIAHTTSDGISSYIDMELKAL